MNRSSCLALLLLLALLTVAPDSVAAPTPELWSKDATAVAGVVVDAEGHPVDAHLDLFYVGPGVSAGRNLRGGRSANGAFRFDGLPRGESYRLYATDDGFACKRTDVIATGRVDVRVVMAPEKTLSGRVIDAEGKPLPGAETKLFTDEALFYATPRATTGADGSFVLHRLGDAAGELVVSMSDGGKSGRAKLVVRRSGVRAADGPVEIALGKGLVIEGLVLDRRGEGVDHIGVEAMPVSRPASENRLHWPSAWTDKEGFFRIEGLDSGRYNLTRWWSEGGRGGGVPLVLEGGRDVPAGRTDVVLRAVLAR